jgi:uncharacterized protein (TIGR02421 family)
MLQPMPISERARRLDTALCAIAPSVKVLSRLSWPESAITDFLHSWRRGEPHIPEVSYSLSGLPADAQRQLERIRDEADPDDPVEGYLKATADSYAKAVELLSHAGTSAFLELSRMLYGDPYGRLPGTYLTHFEAAQQLLDITAPWAAACRSEEQLSCMTAEHVRDEIQSRVDPFFSEHPINIVIDPRLTSKAAAAARRIRIRGKSSYTEADIDQLLEHEAFVHAATALNGKLQPIQAFGLAAPRTTATQEGLATIAELITGSMDLSRLRRLALRIIAVKHVVEGADFVEVFRYFLRAGQSEDESARSAARVFRGGDPRGRIAFTKDVVYLHGLIGVHTFLRRAIFDSRIELIPRLFAGRVTLGDVLRLDSAFEDGDLLPGRYITHWAADARRLAAHLSFSLILNRIKLENVDLQTILAH